MAFSITKRQREVFDFLRDYMGRNNGLAPSYDEIAAGVGLASKSGAFRHIEALAKRGWIEVKPGLARAIRILDVK